jgi:hypothetical protein
MKRYNKKPRGVQAAPDLNGVQAWPYDNIHAPMCRHKKTSVATTTADGNYPNKECYLKEARAMLKGKHCEGKNRCVKLTGDG